MSHFGMLIQFAALSGLVCLLAGCAATGDHGSGARPEPKVVHCVFFTCRPGTPETEVASLTADCEGLGRIPTVRKVSTGGRDLRFAREVNDQEFTIGLTVWFDDKAGHDVYQDHPLHKQFVEKHKAYWAKVRVFDYNAK